MLSIKKRDPLARHDASQLTDGSGTANVDICCDNAGLADTGVQPGATSITALHLPPD